MNYEWVGIVGSIMIILAFTNDEEKVIRIMDGIGAILFIIYGYLTKTWSTMFLNTVLVVVHLWRFWKMRGNNG